MTFAASAQAISRRRLAGWAAILLAAPGVARAWTQRVRLGDAFLLLEPYLELAPDKRNRFHIAYRATRDHAPDPGAQATIIGPHGARTAVALAADGQVLELPTLAQLKSNAEFETKGPSFRFALELRATMAPATRIAVSDLAAALDQANDAVIDFAGGDASAVGRLTTAYFPGSGKARLASAGGEATLLPVCTPPGLGPTPYLELPRAKDATAVLLDKAPSRVMLAGPPRI